MKRVIVIVVVAVAIAAAARELASRRSRTVRVGGAANACDCTHRIEPE